MWGKLSTTCSNVLKQPNGELLVAVNHNQLRTMASETLDLIDWWSHPPPSRAVPPERLMHSINQCNLSGNRTCNRSMRGNHLAYAATQGIKSTMRPEFITVITERSEQVPFSNTSEKWNFWKSVANNTSAWEQLEKQDKKSEEEASECGKK